MLPFNDSTPIPTFPLQGGRSGFGSNGFSGLRKLIFILLLCAVTGTSAKAAPPTEYEVKAAFIHNIAQYVEWPETARGGSALTLCVLGQNPFDGALVALRGKAVVGKVWQVEPATRQSDLRKCHLLFIAASESANLDAILGGIKGAAVLTLGDSNGYAARGVMVNFYLEQNRVRFEINQAAALGGGFKISSQLLKLARIVESAEGTK
jgi:hypothetical protein